MPVGYLAWWVLLALIESSPAIEAWLPQHVCPVQARRRAKSSENGNRGLRSWTFLECGISASIADLCLPLVAETPKLSIACCLVHGCWTKTRLALQPPMQIRWENFDLIGLMV